MSKSVTKQQKAEATESSMGLNGVDFNDRLAIDPALKSELESKNLVWRWTNFKKLKDNHGFDPRMWAPYKRESKPTGGMFEAYGYTDPEGYIRRGDLVLAVQTQEIYNRRKADTDRRRAALNNNQKVAAKQLNETFAEAGVKAKVYSGYDENE